MNDGVKKSMWGGRFAVDPDAFMLEFGASIDIDIELLEVDIKGSSAWVEALARAGILDDGEVATLLGGLAEVGDTLRAQRRDGTYAVDYSLEDIHMTVESRLIDLVGDVGAKLHTGRSRNDQVALDERLYLMGALDDLCGYVAVLQRIILGQAEKHVDTIVPSYTHLQQAQPVRLGHYLMAWFWMLDRDRERFADARRRADACPLGSGAVAGSGFPVDREFIARRLGFSRVTPNSIDATSDRDAVIETLAACSMLMAHLSRICEDLIIWSSAEFGFVTLSERYSTGSSMMPQKKNPDSLELVRGKTGRVYGALVTLLTVLKGLPFSYGKDMQEDKAPLFDTVRTVAGSLRIMSGAVGEAIFDAGRMRDAFDDSVFATDVADYLTAKGLPFRKAHEVAGRLVRIAQERGVSLAELPSDVYSGLSPLFGPDVVAIYDLERSCDRRSCTGGTGRLALLAQFEAARTALEGNG